MAVASCTARFQHLGQLPHAPLRFEAGQTIFEQGEACQAVYLIRSGAVELSIADDRGRKHVLRVAYPGELLGLPAALSSQPYSKSAVASEATMLQRIRIEHFLTFLQSHPECTVSALTCLNEDTVAMQALFKRLLTAHAS